jgi:DNA-3-methyladenine glycosylase II
LILEQQVSLASAAAAFGRLAERVDSVTPDSVLASTQDELRDDGFSRQKARYVLGIAEQIRLGSFLPPVPGDDPDGARERLVSLRGIGPWTASCYLLFVLGEPDVWPDGDRALHVAMAATLHRVEAPTTQEAVEIASAWSPYRSTAARMLWHEYLGGRDYVLDPASGFL